MRALIASPADAAVIDLERVVTHRLKNGLELRLLAVPGVPAVSYYTFFRVGSRHERPGTTGISHLFEHMMFNGAAKYGPKEFDRLLESHGGSSNAYTSNDYTAYHDDFASDALETVVDLESDRMRSLALSPETLAQEREIVKEERRLRTENSVFGLMEEQLEALVFMAHPYRWPIIGWMDDIERITREDCQAFFRTYYAPNNAVIFAAGDLDPDATVRLVERYYGDIPGGPPPPQPPGGEPRQLGERRAVIRYPAQTGAVVVGWRATAARDPDTAALDILQLCLGTGEASRLRRRLVHEKELAVSVNASFGWRVDPGIFLVFVELSPRVRPERATRALEEEIARVADGGVTPAELRRALSLLRAATLHDLATRSGTAHALGQSEMVMGDWREATRWLSRYSAVTSRDVKRVARELLAPGRRSIVTLEPTAPGRGP